MPFDERSEELALALASQAGHLARERHPLRRDPAPVRRLRRRVGDRDRVARSDDVGPLAPRGHAVGRRWPRRSTRATDGPLARRALHAHGAASRSSTPASCTTSARSACARRCWSRPRSSTRRTARAIELRFAYIRKWARGRARRAQAAAGAGAGRATSCRRASPSSTPSWRRSWPSCDERLGVHQQGQRADGAGGGRLRAAGRDRAPAATWRRRASCGPTSSPTRSRRCRSRAAA